MNVEEGKWLLGTLRKIQFFASFSLDNIDSVLKHFQKYSYPAGKTLIKQGDEGEAFFVIRSGSAEVSVNRFVFLKKKVADLGPGSFFGEMSLVFDEPTAASVRTKEPSEVYILLKTDFRKVLAKNPELLNEIRYVAEKRRFESNKQAR